MRVLSKDKLICMLERGESIVRISADTLVTKSAQEYIDKNNILIERSRVEKPEHMTYLDAENHVVKNHPRIVLRGKLDTFQAKILELQVLADSTGNRYLVERLEEILEYSRKILAAEVTGNALDEVMLFGLDEKELRYKSQHPKEFFGVGHVAPTYKMGRECVLLNSLRTMSREVEIAGINAFCQKNKVQREDILQALNRLSSGIYILYCELLSKQIGCRY